MGERYGGAPVGAPLCELCTQSLLQQALYPDLPDSAVQCVVLAGESAIDVHPCARAVASKRTRLSGDGVVKVTRVPPACPTCSQHELHSVTRVTYGCTLSPFITRVSICHVWQQ